MNRKQIPIHWRLVKKKKRREKTSAEAFHSPTKAVAVSSIEMRGNEMEKWRAQILRVNIASSAILLRKKGV